MAGTWQRRCQEVSAWTPSPEPVQNSFSGCHPLVHELLGHPGCLVPAGSR